MSDAVTFPEISEQHAELLPPRTVMSMFVMQPGDGGAATNNCLNVGIPILSGLGVAGTGNPSAAVCT